MTKIFFFLSLLSLSFCSVQYALIGAVTQSSFQVKGRASAQTTLSVHINDFKILINLTTDSDNFFVYNATGLTPNTLYDVVITDLTDSKAYTIDDIRTYPDPKAAHVGDKDIFRMVASTNVNTNSDSDFFNRMMSKQPNLVAYLGDIHRESNDSTSSLDYVKDFETAIMNEANSAILKKTPVIFVPGMNDFCADSCDDRATSNTAFNKAVNNIFPSVSNKTYSSWVASGVAFFVLDTVSFSDADNDTLLGSDQINWLLTELGNAVKNDNVKAILMMAHGVWINNPEKYSSDWIKQKHYFIKSAFEADKAKIGQVIKGLNIKNPGLANFKSVQLIVGDSLLAFDDGLNNLNGGFPTAVCGWVNGGKGTCKGGSYSHGYFDSDSKQGCFLKGYVNTNGSTCFRTEGIILDTKEDKDIERLVFIYDTCKSDLFSKKQLDSKCPILIGEKLINVAISLGSVILVFLIFQLLLYKIAVRTYNFTKKEE